MFFTIFAFGNNNYEEGHLKKHKEVVIICEKSGEPTISYNVIFTTLEFYTQPKQLLVISQPNHY
jgi:hypothetical protein